MQQYRAIIFDRDGVLCDFDYEAAQNHFAQILPVSVFSLAGLWMEWGALHGYPTTIDEENEFFLGFWNEVSSRYSLSTEQSEALLATDYTKFLTSFDEVAQVLSDLKSQGYLIGVLSDFSLASLEQSLAALGLAKHIDVSCAATSIGISKPFPDAYLHVCEKLGVQPQDCLFFDDEEENVLGGRRVGLRSYQVKRSAAPGDVDSSGEPIITHLAEVVRLLEPEVVCPS